MKYGEMIKFMNDNGILLIQPIVADIVDTMLPIGCDISEEEYEEICSKVFSTYIDNMDDDQTLDDIWDYTEKALVIRGYKVSRNNAQSDEEGIL